MFHDMLTVRLLLMYAEFNHGLVEVMTRLQKSTCRYLSLLRGPRIKNIPQHGQAGHSERILDQD